MIATRRPATSLLGLGAVGLFGAGRTTLLLWGTIALLAVVLLLIPQRLRRGLGGRRRRRGRRELVRLGRQQGAFAYFVACSCSSPSPARCWS